MLINEHIGQQNLESKSSVYTGLSFETYKETIPNTYKKDDSNHFKDSELQ